MISTVPTKHKGCTQVHINHGVVPMTSAGEEQAGMLSMFPSAANPLIGLNGTTLFYFVVYEQRYGQVYHGDQIISNIEESCC